MKRSAKTKKAEAAAALQQQQRLQQRIQTSRERSSMQYQQQQSVSSGFKVISNGHSHNETQRVIIAGRSSAAGQVGSAQAAAAVDPFACTCHLIAQAAAAQQQQTVTQQQQQQQQQQVSSSVQQQRHMVTMRSIESSGTDSSQSYHPHQLLHHPHYTRFHRLTMPPGVVPGVGAGAVTAAGGTWSTSTTGTQQGGKVMSADEVYRRHQAFMAERLSLAGGAAGSEASTTLLDCGADGACCSCEWISKALLCSCQLPSSSDEAGSPSHMAHSHHAHAHSGNGNGNGANGGNGQTVIPKEHQC